MIAGRWVPRGNLRCVAAIVVSVCVDISLLQLEPFSTPRRGPRSGGHVLGTVTPSPRDCAVLDLFLSCGGFSPSLRSSVSVDNLLPHAQLTVVV